MRHRTGALGDPLRGVPRPDQPAGGRVRRDPLSARVLIAGLLALLLLAPAVAHAQGRSDPTELQEASPREPSPTPARTVAAAPRERVSVVAPDEGPDAFAIVSLLLLAAGIVATAVSLARDRVRYGGRVRGERRTDAKARAAPAERPAAAQVPRRARAPAPTRPGRAGMPAPAKRRVTKPAPRHSRAPEPPAHATPSWQSCRIELWEGATRKQFYAEDPGGGGRVGQSPFFRVAKGQAIEDSEQATEAFEALVDELIAGGWEITGRTGGWQLLLRRRTGADRQPVE